MRPSQLDQSSKDTFADFIHISGTTANISGWQYAGYDFPSGTASFGHTIASGDKLFLKQYQSTNACGGIVLGFSDGTTTAGVLTDTTGTLADEDNVQNTWHVRTVDLTPYATKVLSRLYLVLDHCTAANSAWDIYYRDISVVANDGTVFPVYNGQSSVSLSMWSSAGMINPAYSVYHMTGEGIWPTESTTYYHGDHLGSSRLMTNAAGYPIWQGTFLPFGYEFNPQTTTNNYKFTGMESDSETGLNHTWFRQQSPVMGRWLTPDPAGVAAVDLSNPQSLNRYAYVLNDPLRWIDPFGLNQCAWDDGTIDDRPEDGGATESQCAAQGGTWIGGTDSTVNVTASSDGYVTTIIFGGPAGFIVLQPETSDDGLTFENHNARVQFKVEPKVTWDQYKHSFKDCAISPDPLPSDVRAGKSARDTQGNRPNNPNTIYLTDKSGTDVPVSGQEPKIFNNAAKGAILVNNHGACMYQELGPVWWP